MSKVPCSVCEANIDARSMSICPSCNSYVCPTCNTRRRGYCLDCAEEGDVLPE